MTNRITVQNLGTQDYQTVWQNMRKFTDARGPDTKDEIWIVEHPPVYTLGLNGKPEHILNAGAIPVVKCDRGGQVTYHGPGQVVIYCMLELNRFKLGVKQLVSVMEQSVIDLLEQYKIHGERKENAPGVYVNDAKIAALGLRIRRGYSYHGLSLNVDMDLTPFSHINPCGFEGLASIQLKDLSKSVDKENIKQQMVSILQNHLQVSK